MARLVGDGNGVVGGARAGALRHLDAFGSTAGDDPEPAYVVQLHNGDGLRAR